MQRERMRKEERIGVLIMQELDITRDYVRITEKPHGYEGSARSWPEQTPIPPWDGSDCPVQAHAYRPHITREHASVKSSDPRKKWLLSNLLFSLSMY